MSANQFFGVISGARKFITAIASSSGVGDALKIISTNSSGVIDSTLLPPGVGLDTTTYPASEALSAGDEVNIYSNSSVDTVRKADASNGRRSDGYVLASVTSGGTATVYKGSTNTAKSGLTTGSEYYLSDSGAGGVTATIPTTSGHGIQYLGVAASPTALIYNPDAYIVIA